MVAEFFELSGNDRCGEVGGVAVATEVPKDDAGEALGGDLTDEVGGLVVRKVTVAIRDSLLGGPGTMGIVLEHDFVVVCLGEEGVDALQAIDNEAGDVADVAEDAEAAVITSKDEADGIDGVVGDGKGFDVDVVDLKIGSGFEMVPFDLGFDLFADDGAGVGGRVDGHLALATEDVDPAGVVAVLVGEDYGGKVIWLDAEGLHPYAELAGGKACVDQNGGLAKTDEGTVS